MLLQRKETSELTGMNLEHLPNCLKIQEHLRYFLLVLEDQQLRVFPVSPVNYHQRHLFIYQTHQNICLVFIQDCKLNFGPAHPGSPITPVAPVSPWMRDAT